MLKDPVCGFDIEDRDGSVQLDYEGKIYHFCSNECKHKFERNPQAYIGTSKKDVSNQHRKHNNN